LNVSSEKSVSQILLFSNGATCVPLQHGGKEAAGGAAPGVLRQAGRAEGGAVQVREYSCPIARKRLISTLELYAVKNRFPKFALLSNASCTAT
jgi:hypothetical protein